jgi:hypothetical protein
MKKNYSFVVVIILFTVMLIGLMAWTERQTSAALERYIVDTGDCYTIPGLTVDGWQKKQDASGIYYKNGRMELRIR